MSSNSDPSPTAERDPKQPHSSAGFLRLSALINGLFVIEAAIGFLFDLLIVAMLGLSAMSDALYAAWMLPQTIGRGLFQSLPHSLMGVFGEQEDTAAAYGGAVVAISYAVWPFSILLSVTSGWWVPWTIPGAAVSTQITAIELAQILAFLPALLALAELFRAIFYVEERFYWPSVARVLGGVVALLLVAWALWQKALVLAAWAILIGAVIEAIFNFVGLAQQLGYRTLLRSPSRRFLREITFVGGAPVAGLAVRILASVGERAIASFIGAGGVTVVTFAMRIITSIERFALRGFVISATNSALRAEDANMTAQIRAAYLVSLPIGVVLALLSGPFVSVLFGYTNLDANSVNMLAQILIFYAPGVIILAVSRVPFGYAFAYKDSLTIFGFYALMGLGLIGAEAALIAVGIQLPAFGIGFTVSLLICLIWLYWRGIRPEAQQDKKVGYLGSRREIGQLLGVGALSFIGTALVVKLMAVRFASATVQAGFWPQMLTLCVGGGMSILLVVAGMFIFRLPEGIAMLTWLRTRVRRTDTQPEAP